jgi:hypothetical protein
MKQFDKLIDALQYQKHCPACRGELVISESNLASSYDTNDPNHQKIVFEISIQNDELVYIDPLTNDVELVVWDAGNKIIHKDKNNLGTFGHSLKLECIKCCMYYYVIQVWVNLNIPQLVSVILNSESISWEDPDRTLHEIVCSYVTNKTTYTYFSVLEQESGTINLPIVPLDIDNPENTVNRIQSLLVFS